MNIKNYLGEKLKLLIVGSLAYDSISTEVNKVENTLGDLQFMQEFQLQDIWKEYSTIQRRNRTSRSHWERLFRF